MPSPLGLILAGLAHVLLSTTPHFGGNQMDNGKEEESWGCAPLGPLGVSIREQVHLSWDLVSGPGILDGVLF